MQSIPNSSQLKRFLSNLQWWIQALSRFSRLALRSIQLQPRETGANTEWIILYNHFNSLNTSDFYLLFSFISKPVMYFDMSVNTHQINWNALMFLRLDWEMVLADLGRKLTTALRSLGNSPVINEEVLERNVIWDFIRVFKQSNENDKNFQMQSVA